MSMEEFHARINRFKDMEAYYEKIYIAYSTKLPEELVALVLNHWQQDVQKNVPQLKPSLYKLANKFARDIWEDYNLTVSDQFKKEAVKPLFPIPKPKSKTDAEQELRHEFEKYPEDFHEELTKTFWDMYYKHKKHEDFLYAVYQKTKEVFTENYFNEIVDWDGDYLRQLDSRFYCSCDFRFVQPVYNLLWK